MAKGLKKSLKREFSAGGIVFNGKGQVLLIQTESTKDHETKYWGFPKGHIEEGQTTKDAALREVHEEGGVIAEIISKIGDMRYVYTRDGQRIFKVVVIYLMRYKSGDPKDHDHEVLEAQWFALEDALQKLSFAQDKKLLEKAFEMSHKE